MRNRYTSLAGGALLICLGLLFLAFQLIPGLGQLIKIEFTWPFIIVAIGLGLLVLGILLGTPGMAIPACIVGGIGTLLWWQNLTGNWESWSYVWALIPGFVGVGIILSSLLGGKEKIAEGAKMVLVSLVMFAIFGSFFGAIGLAGRYWPVLLILLGIIVLAQAVFRNRD